MLRWWLKRPKLTWATCSIEIVQYIYHLEDRHKLLRDLWLFKNLTLCVWGTRSNHILHLNLSYFDPLKFSIFLFYFNFQYTKFPSNWFKNVATIPNTSKIYRYCHIRLFWNFLKFGHFFPTEYISQVWNIAHQIFRNFIKTDSWPIIILIHW